MKYLIGIAAMVTLFGMYYQYTSKKYEIIVECYYGKKEFVMKANRVRAGQFGLGYGYYYHLELDNQVNMYVPIDKCFVREVIK